MKKELKNPRAATDCLDGGVAVTAQLDVHALVVAELAQGREDRREVHGPLAEHEVLMDALDHVLDMDVEDARAPSPQVLGDGPGLDAVDMPQVDGEMKRGWRTCWSSR